MPNNIKVLIIEDDPIIANIYRSRLEKEGFQVEIASDGQTGFYRTIESRPSALLLDLMLPKMDGIQILRKIRAQKAFQGTPVIVFTNAYVPNMIQEATLAGATVVFNKAALTPRQIIEAINNALFPNSGGQITPVASTSATPSPQTLPSSGTGPVFAPTVISSPASFNQPPPPPSVQAPKQSFFQTPPVPTPPPSARPTMPFNPPPLQKGPSLNQQTSVQNTQPEVAQPQHVAPLASEANSSSFSSDGDDQFQQELLQSFLGTAPESLSNLRKSLQDFIKSPNDSSRMPQLYELYRKVHAITGNAAIVGLSNIAQMSSAMEALIKEIYEKPKNITLSTTRTVAHSVDFLSVLFEKGLGPSLLEQPPVSVLVVDDEIISRRAVTYALEKAQLKSESIEDPNVAMQLLNERRFDLVILDVDMPGMSGFELCSKLRTMPQNQNTPVLFVTNLTDFESRAKSSLSGGNDLIAKPFLFIELTVKALSFVFKNRLGIIKN